MKKFIFFTLFVFICASVHTQSTSRRYFAVPDSPVEGYTRSKYVISENVEKQKAIMLRYGGPARSNRHNQWAIMNELERYSGVTVGQHFYILIELINMFGPRELGEGIGVFLVRITAVGDSEHYHGYIIELGRYVEHRNEANRLINESW